LACLVDHRGRGVDADDRTAREALQQELGYPPATAPGVEDGLIAAELEAVDDGQRPFLLDVRHAVVGRRVPVPMLNLLAHSAVVTGPRSAPPACSKAVIESSPLRVIPMS